MNKYEAMFVIKPDLSEEDRKSLFNQIADTITKNGGKISNSGIWSERRKMHFKIKKFDEGVYYLVDFTSPTGAITKLKYSYGLNESILRTLILAQE